jgi:AbiV family abortive infection protein
MAKPDPKLIATMNACAVHARDLLQSAEAIQTIGHFNIAYHLAALSLEELGRRELAGIQEAANKTHRVRPWQSKAAQDHTKKLFGVSMDSRGSKILSIKINSSR